MVRILLVDDERALRETLVEVLEIQGYSVISVGSFHEASTLLTEYLSGSRQIDLLLSDYELTDGLGTELIRTVVVRQLRFILMSGRSQSEVRLSNDWLAWGRFLPKPIKAKHLSQTIRELLPQ